MSNTSIMEGNQVSIFVSSKKIFGLQEFGMGNRLREIRIEKGLSQQQLADMVHPSTTDAQISRLEKGTRSLSNEWCIRLSKALGVEPIDILPEEFSKDQSTKDLESLFELSTRAVLVALKTSRQQLDTDDTVSAIMSTYKMSKAVGNLTPEIVAATLEGYIAKQNKSVSPELLIDTLREHLKGTDAAVLPSKKS